MDCLSARRKEILRSDVERNSLADSLFKVRLQLFDLCAAAADDHAGLRYVDIDANALCVTFDLDLGYTGGSERFQEILAKLIVFHEGVAEVLLLGIPTRFPVFDNTDS